MSATFLVIGTSRLPSFKHGRPGKQRFDAPRGQGREFFIGIAKSKDQADAYLRGDSASQTTRRSQKGLPWPVNGRKRGRRHRNARKCPRLRRQSCAVPEENTGKTSEGEGYKLHGDGVVGMADHVPARTVPGVGKDRVATGDVLFGMDGVDFVFGFVAFRRDSKKTDAMNGTCALT